MQTLKISLVNREFACNNPSCKNKAISLSHFCWEHTPDKILYIEDLRKYLNNCSNGDNFILRKIVLPNADLIKVSLKNSDLTQADFRDANFSYSDICESNLIGCNLEGADLTGVNFVNSDLTRCNLKKARLWHADLSAANLSEADLQDADLWECKMSMTRLWYAKLKNTKSLTKQNFSKKIFGFWQSEKIDEKGILSAEESYRALKQYFTEMGRYGDASWASFKEKTMEKLWLLKNKNIAYLPMAAMGLLCGYGEKPVRIIFSSIALIFIYAAMYYNLNAIAFPSNALNYNFWDYVYYSIVTFTTLGYGDLVPRENTGYRMLAGSEAFIGAFMIGLFVFTLSRKYSAR